ncbi:MULTISPECIES: GYD domain-containing protein [Nocardia]|uniref:GYD domain-containing protein n=1 Tax=Nocardia TaxID=1817 RepID=UPI000D690B34|nr:MULTISPECIES: GYD domain-containing protein [Nocardia]
MQRFLWEVTYSSTGAGGLVEEGGAARRDAIVRAVESVGGTVESCYFALGAHDLYVTGTVPDNEAAAALAIRTAASGAASSHSIPLLTPEQVDDAVRRAPDYRPPGS